MYSKAKVRAQRAKFAASSASLKALAVDNGRTRLVVLLLGDPHLLEGGEGGEDGATDPDGVFALWRGDDLDLHRRGSETTDLFLHAVSDSGVHGGATGEDGVGVEVLANVDITLHDGVVGCLVDSRRLHSEEGWLEEGLGASESLVANGDNLAVGKFVAFLERRAG